MILAAVILEGDKNEISVKKITGMTYTAHFCNNFLYLRVLNGGGKITHIFTIPYSIAPVYFHFADASQVFNVEKTCSSPARFSDNITGWITLLKHAWRHQWY